jgi:ABC-type lipoprotein export system ATPase subunit
MARPTAGRIVLREREITSLPERFLSAIRRHTFGFIFQQSQLIRGVSVLENVMIPAYPTGEGHSSLRAKALALLDLFDIPGKASSKVEWLSGGEQQRVSIARALINDPPFIVADEPTAHLDSKLSVEFMDIMGTLKEKGKTIIIASHDPNCLGIGGRRPGNRDAGREDHGIYVYVYFASATLFEHALKGWSTLFPSLTLRQAVNAFQIAVLFFLTVVTYSLLTIVPTWGVAVTDPDSVRGSSFFPPSPSSPLFPSITMSCPPIIALSASCSPTITTWATLFINLHWQEGSWGSVLGCSTDTPGSPLSERGSPGHRRSFVWVP